MDDTSREGCSGGRPIVFRGTDNAAKKRGWLVKTIRGGGRMKGNDGVITIGRGESR